MKIKFNFIHSYGRAEDIYVYVEAVSDFAFIESLVSEFKLKRKNVPGKKEINVYVDEDSDFEFIASIVSTLKYEINNDRVQDEWCVGNQDDYEYQNYPAQDDTAEKALCNIEVAEINAAVRAAVKKLNPTERFIINRLYFDQPAVTKVQLAEEMGITSDLLYKRFERIKKKLKVLL